MDGATNKVTVWRSGKAHTPEHFSKEQDIALGPVIAFMSVHPVEGYGDRKRSPEDVLEDVSLGRYTTDEARDLFGVAISGKPLSVDDLETERLRQQ